MMMQLCRRQLVINFLMCVFILRHQAGLITSTSKKLLQVQFVLLTKTVYKRSAVVIRPTLRATSSPDTEDFATPETVCGLLPVAVIPTVFGYVYLVLLTHAGFPPI
jgi:hypothetical protein